MNVSSQGSDGQANGISSSGGPPISSLRKTRDHTPELSLPSHSGRRLILIAGVIGLALWGSLYLIFRDWRARYQARARFGAEQVAPVIDALAETLPPDVDPNAWRDAVRKTHDLLLTVTASNLLDRSQMEALRQELQQTVARAEAHPETAVAELAGVWDRIAARAGFVFRDGRSATGERHPRPKLLSPSLKAVQGR
jgi:hypothetical protein